MLKKTSIQVTPGCFRFSKSGPGEEKYANADFNPPIKICFNVLTGLAM